MGVALSSLRVVGDFDASGYTRGAQQKVAADGKMIASDDRRAASIAAAQAAMAKATQAQLQNSAAAEAALAPGAKVLAQYDRQTAAIAAMAAQTGALNLTLAKQAAANDNAAASSSHVADGMRMATKTAADYAISSLTAAAKATALTLVLGAVATILGGLYLVYKAAKIAIDLVTDAWTLGNEKLAEYVAIGQKATIVSTDFYQRLQKSATDAKQPIDILTDAVKKLNDASAPKLGGSEAQNRIDELTKAGNFKGDAGIAQFASANGAEEKFRAISSLIDQAMQKGERLAALDLSAKFLGPDVTARLAADSDYLNRMLTAADRISGTDLVSAADVGRATELQARYDAAAKILSERWHPLQNLLTSAGMAMKSVFVSVVESIASAVDWAGKLVEKLTSFPYWARIKDGLSIMSSGYRVPEGPIYTDPKTFATDQLRAGLQNPNAVAQGRDQTNNLYNSILGDKSFNPEKKKQIDDVKDALERATDSVEKYILTTEASARSVGAGVAAQEKAKVIAQLTAAAQRDGKTDLDKYAAAWETAGDRAGAAALKFAKAQIDSQIKSGRETAFFSAEDVAIAQQLKDIISDIGERMKSPEAVAIRFNNQLKSINDIVRSAATSFTTDLVGGLRKGESAMTAIGHAAQNLSSTLTTGAIASLLKGDFIAAGIQGIGALISGIIGDNQKKIDEQIAKAKAAYERAVNYDERAKLAGIDTSTRAGALAQFDIQAASQRAAEAANGNIALVNLEWALHTERVAIQAQFDAKELADQKTALDAKAAIQKAAQDAQAAAEKAAQDASLARMTGYHDRLFATTIDASTLEGSLAVFDRQAQKERLAEIAAGGEQIALLTQTQEAERLSIYKKFGDAAATAAENALKQIQDAANASAKNIVDYIGNLQSGPGSTLSPQDTLANARSLYNANLGLAQSGNIDAQNKFTSLADNLEKASRAFYGSSVAYQTDRNQIMSQGLALPAVTATTDPVVQAMRDVETAINNAAVTAAKDATLASLAKDKTVSSLLTQGQLDELGLSKDVTVGGLFTAADLVNAKLSKDQTVSGLLTKDQLDQLGLSKDLTVGDLKTGIVLAEQKLVLDAVKSGTLTEKQVTDLGLAKDLTAGNILTEKQFTDAKLSKDVTLGGLLTKDQLEALKLSTESTVGNLLTAKAFTDEKLSKDATLGGLLTEKQLTDLGLSKNVTVGGLFKAKDLVDAKLATEASLSGPDGVIKQTADTAWYSGANNSHTQDTSFWTKRIDGGVGDGNKKIDASNTVLGQIKELNATSKDQLTTLNGALGLSTALDFRNYNSTLRVPQDDNRMNETLSVQSQNVPTLLEKIVVNTFAIAKNTAANVNGGAGFSTPLFASGGWITGGIPGRDSVPLASGGLGMPGEFVVQKSIAQRDAAFLPDYNAGLIQPFNDNLPSLSFAAPNVVPLRGGNADVVAELRAVKAELAEIKKGMSLIASNTGNTVRATVAAAEHVGGKVDQVRDATLDADRENQFAKAS